MGRKFIIEFADTVSDEQVAIIVANHRAAVGLYKSVVEVAQTVPAPRPFRVGDKVVDALRPDWGEGEVLSIDLDHDGDAYPVYAAFPLRAEKYTLDGRDGRYWSNDDVPRLKHVEP